MGRQAGPDLCGAGMPKFRGLFQRENLPVPEVLRNPKTRPAVTPPLNCGISPRKFHNLSYNVRKSICIFPFYVRQLDIGPNRQTAGNVSVDYNAYAGCYPFVA
jgi:hypothetical protein